MTLSSMGDLIIQWTPYFRGHMLYLYSIMLSKILIYSINPYIVKYSNSIVNYICFGQVNINKKIGFNT